MQMLRAILSDLMGDESTNTDGHDFTLFSCFENAKRALTNRAVRLMRFEVNCGRLVKESVG